jgi:hypothetical protein
VVLGLALFPLLNVVPLQMLDVWIYGDGGNGATGNIERFRGDNVLIIIPPPRRRNWRRISERGSAIIENGDC